MKVFSWFMDKFMALLLIASGALQIYYSQWDNATILCFGLAYLINRLDD